MKFVVLFICCFIVPSSWCQPAEGDLRLAYGGPRLGLLEIFWNGTWGTVNRTGFTQKDSDVACRHLGFPNTTGHVISMEDLMKIGMNMSAPNATGMNMPPANTSSANMSCWLEMPECNGNASMMHDCVMGHLMHAQCTPAETIHIHCMGNFSAPPAANDSMGPEVQFRLADGNDTNNGRLEINMNGTWQSICANMLFMMYPNFSSNVCRRLGYSDGGEKFVPIFYTTPQWMSDVQCMGDEMMLNDCQFNVPQRVNHTEDVWMACAPQPPPAPAPQPPSPPAPAPDKPTTKFSAGPACKKDAIYKKHKADCSKWCNKNKSKRSKNKHDKKDNKC